MIGSPYGRILGIGMSAAIAAMSAVGLTAPPIVSRPPVVQTPAQQKRRGKRKREKTAPTRRWTRGTRAATTYRSTRRFHAARSSTLKKTARWLRLGGKP